LTEYKIEHNHCIDAELIAKLTPNDSILQN